MKPIPEMREPERYAGVDFTSEEFIELRSNEYFEIAMQYPLLGMDNAESQCFVRKEVYERLIEAAHSLPKGYKFKILDAWRPFAFQKELFVKYSDDIIKEFELEECSDEQKKVVICKFVSDPIDDIIIPPVHTTGGAIDLTIIDENGKELDMGSEFDEFTNRTYTCFYENEKDDTIRDNRRLLYNIMTEVGFTNLPSEWWHFDYGDRFWAFYNETPAKYEGVFTKEEVYEATR